MHFVQQKSNVHKKTLIFKINFDLPIGNFFVKTLLFGGQNITLCHIKVFNWHMWFMIWFYLHKIAALRPNYNVQYKTRRRKKKPVWPETKLKVQQQTTEKQGQTVKQASKEENRKQEVQLWEFAVDQLHMIWDLTTSISISASTGLGEFGIVPQLPTIYIASALREQHKSRLFWKVQFWLDTF